VPAADHHVPADGHPRGSRPPAESTSAPLRIAILGTRGIPPAYGGFETFAWELSRELAARGHELTVYAIAGRTDETRSLPPGVRRRFVPGVAGKHLETVSHAATAALDVLVRGHDVVLVCNAANAFVCAAPRLRGSVVVLNVDGIERKRAKWGLAGRLWYRLGERLALWLPNAIVSDAEVIADHYRVAYGRETTVIAYGAPILERDPPPDLARRSDALTGIRPDRYVLYVSRLEPENQADLVIRAYARVPGDVPLLIVGDAPYASDFKRAVRDLAAADPRVRLTGALYGEAYTDLQRGALAYVQATSVGGTHPALIEAMGAGNLVLAFDVPEHHEVAGSTALWFRDAEGLAAELSRVLADPHAPDLEALRGAARRRVAERYAWPAVADAYERLLRDLLRRD
jgi:glycosyltransferase involved in cell wall biosynthesis